MRKLLGFVLAAVLMLCLTGCAEGAAAIPDDLYGDVLANFYDIIAHPEERTEFAEGEFGVFEAANALGADALDAIGYVLTDLNGDGTDELLVGVFDKPEGAHVKNELYAAYTYDGQQPVLLFEGSARSAYSLMEGGSFYYYGSGGAMYSIFGEAVLNDNSALEWVDYYFTYETDETRTEIGFFHNNSGVWDPAEAERLDIDGDAFWALQEAYAKRTAELADTKFAQLGGAQ